MKKADHIKALIAINQKCKEANEAAGSPDSVHNVATPDKLTIKEIVHLTADYEKRIDAYNKLTLANEKTKVETQTEIAAQQKPTQESNTMAEKTNKELCTPIIVDGFKQKLTRDAIISNCFDAGVRSIAELMKLYAEITVEQNLVVDPKKATELLKAEIVGSDWASVTSWAQIDAIILEIQETVKGTEAVRIKTLITQYCNKEGIVLPAKEGTGATGGLKSVGGVAMAKMVELFTKDPKTSKYDCLMVVGPTSLATCKDPVASAKQKVNKVYTALYAVANSVSLGEALVATCKQTFDAPVVAEEPVEA